jgi:hypothetical protein
LVVPEALERVGFRSLVDYSENDKTRVWLAMKDYGSRGVWFGRSQASAELDFGQRMSESSYASLLTADSARIVAYKFPPQASEAAWCGEHQDHCNGGHGFDPFVSNIPVTGFHLKHSGVGDRAGRGVYARQLIPEGSTLGLEMCVHRMYLPPPTYSLFNSMFLPADDDDDNDVLWKAIHEYVWGYGWVDNDYVRITLQLLPRLIADLLTSLSPHRLCLLATFSICRAHPTRVSTPRSSRF